MGAIVMNQFRRSEYATETGRKWAERRTELMQKARGRDNKRAVRALAEEHHMKVYTPAEVNAFVAERPELLTREVIGHSEWDMSKPNFTY